MSPGAPSLPGAEAPPEVPPVEAREPRPTPRLLVVRFSSVALLVAADLWSKAAVFGWLGPLRERGQLELHDCGLYAHPRLPLAGEWLAFMLSENKGAAFGQLSELPYLLVGGRILAGLFLIWLLLRASPARPWVATGFVLILGGALGNLYDNLFLDHPHDTHPFGPVRDFIDVYFGFADWHFPTFNVADSCITVGAVLLVVTGFFGSKPRAAA